MYSSSMALGRMVFSLSARQMSTDSAPAVKRVGSTLYETLARLPGNGVGAQVAQRRWTAKGIEGSYWEVTKVKLKNEGRSGKAWGKLVWRGELISRVERVLGSTDYRVHLLDKTVSERPEQIRGGLKYFWSDVKASTPS